MPAKTGRTFSLSSLMLLVAAFAIWLTMFANYSCLAVAALAFLVPAFARTVEMLRLIQRQGRTASWGEALDCLLASLLGSVAMTVLSVGLMFIVGTALLLFFGMLFELFGGALKNSGWEMVATGTIVVATGATGVSFLVYMFWKAWPHENS